MRTAEDQVASGILEYNGALSAEFCLAAIERFDADSRSFRSNPDWVSAAGSRDSKVAHNLEISKHKDWFETDRFLFSTVAKYARLYQDAYKTSFPILCSGFSMSRYDIGDFCHEHKDAWFGQTNKPVLSLVYYLNDVAEGGEIVFPAQQVSIKPKQGTLIVYPSDFTHRHLVTPVVSNPRYIAMTFLSYAGQTVRP